MAALGLVAYGSDDDESVAGSDVAVEGSAGVVLLGEYAQPAVRINADSGQAAPQRDSAENATPGQAMDIDAAGDEAADRRSGSATSAAPDGEPEAAVGDEALGGLPPELALPPPGNCLPELQEKVTRFLAIQRDKGREIKSELRHARGYRNPDFLQKMVDDLEIHNAGSNFPKDVFDPDALHKEDFYEALRKEWEKEQDRRAQERQASGRVDFTSSGRHSGQAGGAPRPSGLPGSSGDLQAVVQRAKAQAAAKAAAKAKGSRWDNR